MFAMFAMGAIIRARAWASRIAVPSLSRLFCGYLRNACQGISSDISLENGQITRERGFSNASRRRIITLAAEGMNNETAPLWFTEGLR